MERNTYKHAMIWVLAVLLAAPVTVFGQNNGMEKTFSRAELDQMLAPVALYSDSLLAQVLVAATYPDEVVEADRWVKEHPDLKGDALNAELDKMDWDLSVKALVPFPQVLAMMDDHLDWTRRLGEAFLAQQDDVMASIQGLRSKAYAKGNLKSTDQQKVVVQGEDIEIEPAQPDVVYVPTYDPTVIYGDWWWPAYPPFAYFPFGVPFITLGLFGFFAGIGVGPFWGWGWGYWNWGGGNVFVNVNRTVNINDPHANISRAGMRTDSFHNLARTGRIGSIGTGRLGGGRTGTGGRPSAASVERGLSHGGTGGPRGGGARGTGNVSRGGTSHGRSNVARGGGTRGTGNVSRGGAARHDLDIGAGARRGSSVPHGGARNFAPRASTPHFGGGAPHMGGGAPHGGGGGAPHGGGGGAPHGGGGARQR